MTPPADDDRIDPRVWRICCVVCLGPLLSNLDSTVVNVSLSTLKAELGAPFSTIQWVTTAYLLTLALVLPMSGWLVDRVGAKRVYLGCFTLFTISSVMCGMAGSANSLIACRVLQGASGGLLAPMAQMMAARIAGRHVARVISVVAMPAMLGTILGPVIAGFILDHASWRWLFFLNLPIGVLAVVLAWIILPSDEDERRPRSFDLTGFLLLSPALALLLYGIEQLSAPADIGDRFARYEVLVGVVLIVLFVAHARRLGERAIVDIQLFRQRTFRASALTQFCGHALIYAGQFILPLYLLNRASVSVAELGWTLAPMGLGMLSAYPFLGGLTERFGPRRVSTFGAGLAYLATLPFAFNALRDMSLVLIGALFFLRGLGLGSINIPSISAAYSALPKEAIPVATTAINIVQRLGGPIATTVLALYLEKQSFAHALQGADGPDAFVSTMRLLCALQLLPVVAALRLPLEHVGRKQPAVQATPR